VKPDDDEKAKRFFRNSKGETPNVFVKRRRSTRKRMPRLVCGAFAR